MSLRAFVNILTIWIPIAVIRRGLRGFLLRNLYNMTMDKKIKNEFVKNYTIFTNVPDDFEFKKTLSTTVSIIIPCYNQYEYTKKCLYSILQNTHGIDYEIIIADDCSTDETKDILNHIKNITVVRPESNLRFLKNCNNAAKQARGKYVLFLNNDTQVMPNWLSHLVNLIESDKTIGMVGSMLLYPDFSLQEAGGIIYSDAGGCNYGRGKLKPWSGEYNYVKDVDYISGAAIMLAKETWEKLGGFDELFAPAYYEDTDLAFRIRNDLKKRVVYQPLSRVIHFEGKSNGTDLSSGQKRYQVINAEKFQNKWKEILSTAHCKPHDIFYARDRSKDQKCLLFIDSRFLTYDKDCGSRASFKYLEFFKKHGLNVKYLAKAKYPYDYHKDTIEQMGIEIICSDDLYDKRIQKWFEENGKYIDYIYLNRPDVAQWCMKYLKKYTTAKIIYQGHDLHHLRMMREYQINPSKRLLKATKRMEHLEKTLLPQMDTVVYFSDVEIDKIKEMNLNVKKLDTVPLYVFDDVSNMKYVSSKRQDIMFIGGYNHVPNVDAANWLVNDIMQAVWAKNPNIKLHLVGSNMPKQLQNLASKYENIIIDGFVTDTELKELYSKIKLSIIPLRFGAGVKGKIVDSMYNNVPVITTSIGAEGISSDEQFIIVRDDTDSIVKAIVDVYDDNEKLQKISDKSSGFIMDNFSTKTVLNKFKQWMDIQ
ncbi:MAG: glycosyltransferase [Alphaproteobacteria bacterium]|nr:glycosyltransferase [Alphaproteobacteria bacterium]